MDEFHKPENEPSQYLNLLDILREKGKIRLSSFQAGECITLEYSIAGSSLELEEYTNRPSFSKTKHCLISEANVNPQSELSPEMFSSSNINDEPITTSGIQDIQYTNKDQAVSEASYNPQLQISSSSNVKDDQIITSGIQDIQYINEDPAVFDIRDISQRPPKVFISYSHDSQEHKKRVKELSSKLRNKRIDCWIDQYVEHSPPENWSSWMRRQIEEAKFVLVVCTQQYKERINSRKGGSGWEGAIIEEEECREHNANKFIRIIFNPDDKKYKPSFLGGNLYCLDVNNQQKYNEQFEMLGRQLTNQPAVKVPPLGKLPWNLPPEE